MTASPQPTHDIVIAGAGLTTALTLHARGIRVLVLESTPEIKPLGVGINLQPPAVQALAYLGLHDTLEPFAISTSQSHYLTLDGTTLATRTFTSDEQQIAVHRGQLQQMLLDATLERLGEQSVRTGQRVAGFEEAADGVRVQIDGDQGSAETVEARVLIGADGVYSAVRQ